MPDLIDTFMESAEVIAICGVERKTVTHLLFRCTRWNEQRRTLIEATGPSFGSLSLILGGRPGEVSETSESNGRAWKPDIKVFRAVIAFAMETELLAPE